jgi:hypothetical protein
VRYYQYWQRWQWGWLQHQQEVEEEHVIKAGFVLQQGYIPGEHYKK